MDPLAGQVTTLLLDGDRPSAVGGHLSGTEDVPLRLTWAAFGVSEPANSELGLGILITQLPGEGQLWLEGVALGSAGQVIGRETIEAGGLVFQPRANASSGQAYPASGLGDQHRHYAQIEFKPSQAGTVLGEAAYLTLDIQPVADSPSISLAASAVQGQEDSAIALGAVALSYADQDGSESHSLSLSGIPPGASLVDAAGHRFDNPAQGPASASLDLARWDLASLALTPPADFNGTITLLFTATAQERAGAVVLDVSSATETMRVQVAPVNDAPVVANAQATGAEDGVVAVTLSGTDVDGQIASFLLETLPNHGQLYSDAAATQALSAGATLAAVGNSATVYFKPSANWSGSTAFQYSATDDQGLNSNGPAAAVLTLVPVSDTPTLQQNTSTSLAATNFQEVTVATYGVIAVSRFGNGVWHTDNPGASIEVGKGTSYGLSTGTQIMELERNTGDPSNFYTTVSVLAGGTYTLSLDYSPRASHLGDSQIGVYWGSQLLTTLSGSAAGLRHYSLTLPVSSDGSEKLELRAVDRNGTGGLLDNIQVVESRNSGTVDHAILLSKLSAQLTDTDGSETLGLAIGRLPAGALLSDGSQSASVTQDGASVDITGWNLAALRLTPPAGFAGDLNLSVTATARDGSAAPASVTQDLTVHVTSAAPVSALAATAVLPNSEEPALPSASAGAASATAGGALSLHELLHSEATLPVQHTSAPPVSGNLSSHAQILSLVAGADHHLPSPSG